MKNLLSSVALIGLAGAASAGGLDRSGQGIGLIFEEGDVVQLSFGHVNPTVSSNPAAAAGDIGESYTQLGFGVKQDLSDNLSLAMIVDQPFGANVSYPGGPLVGTGAEVETLAVTGLLKYSINENVSVYGGLRVQRAKGSASVPAVAGYTLQTDASIATGYVVGAAYELPDIALRVALTYNSATSHDFDATEGGAIPGTTAMTVEMPASINLDFQTGIAKDTLLFGSIRYAMWDGFEIAPLNYGLATGGQPLASFDNNTVTYNLGVGRRLNDNWSAAISFGYEKANGGVASNLAPTDGFRSVGLGATYTSGSTKVSGGIRYVEIGDATTGIPIPFEDNSAIGVGFSITQSF